MTTPPKQPDFAYVDELLSKPIALDRALEPMKGDIRDGSVFLADHDLKLAITIALSTGRPLLLRGFPGTGKSSVAAFVARRLGWRYYEMVMTSETLASDLLWRYDAVRRLADAQAAGARLALSRRPASDNDGRPASHAAETPVELPAHNYVEPGPLWWAQSPESAARRGAPDGIDPATRAVDPSPGSQERAHDAAVVLIDEIDKAEPNVPNALLVPLGSQSFVVEPTGQPIELDRTDDDAPMRLLVIITTNEERQLPRAFIRRCIVHTMPLPNVDRMVAIARLHDEAAGHSMSPDEQGMCLEVAKRVESIQEELIARTERPPGTAEFLDAWRTARKLELSLKHADWKFVEQASLRKDLGDLLEQARETDADKRS